MSDTRTIREMLLDAIKEMDHDTLTYTKTIDTAAAVEVSYRQATNDLTKAEEELRSGMIVRGVPGTNEAARQAIVKLELSRDPVVSDRRAVVEKLSDERTKADAEARKWDVYQKAARAKVVALSALVNRD